MKIKKILKKIFVIEGDVRAENFHLEVIVFVIFLLWGFYFLGSVPSPQDRLAGSDSFLHNINLIFHEAGHILFMVFGNRFLTVLGGSLMQCLIPLIVMIYFLRKRKNFSASIMFWWLGQNFVDLAPYVYDAHDQAIILLGGGTGRDMPGYHDWRYLLTAMNLLPHYSKVAFLVNVFGKIILLLSFIWSAGVLHKKFLFLKSKR
ncbi:MAG: hypothetical protein OXJ52_02735 [Oligoflexia bacterium]|nr:hypothetical protein [Oligoflexia bacterium]